jgi:hypothetical protein
MGQQEAISLQVKCRHGAYHAGEGHPSLGENICEIVREFPAAKICDALKMPPGAFAQSPAG